MVFELLKKLLCLFVAFIIAPGIVESKVGMFRWFVVECEIESHEKAFVSIIKADIILKSLPTFLGIR